MYCEMRVSLGELRRAIDPRLEWVHDKVVPYDQHVTEPVSAVVWYIRSGGVTVSTDQGTWTGRTGDWVFLLPGRRLQAFLPDTRIVSICYRFGRPRGSPWYAAADVLVHRHCPELDLATEALLAATAAASGMRPLGSSFSFACQPLEWLHIEAAFRAWLAAAFTLLRERGVELAVPSLKDDRVARTLAVIQRDPWTDSAEPAALAAAVGLSRRRLEQLFAAALGHGVAEERDRLRLAHAQDALGQTGMQVKQIAQRFGFASSPAFSSWFHRHAGMSPRSFRGKAGQMA